jgi:lipopolysaccharide heptosyltransferase II
MSILRKRAPSDIGIFLPSWLGDFAMATPTLRAIREHCGKATRIVGIMRPYLKEVLAGTDWLDEQWYFDPHGRSPETGHSTILRRIREAEFDMMILMPNSPRSALLAWLGGATERIGYARNGRGPLLTGRTYRPKIDGRYVDLPMVDYYLRLAETIGCPRKSRRLELRTTDADESSADGVFENLGLRQDGRIMTLNCSGAYGAAKLWPIEHFAELAQRIAGDLDHDILVMCGPNEQTTAREITRLAGHPRVFSMADQPLGIGTAKACIRRSRLMVSTDSGPRHIAAALGCAVVTVYGPMLPVWGRNPTVDAVDVYQKDLDCIGCGRRRCPYGHYKCMRELSVNRVFEEVASWAARNERTTLGPPLPLSAVRPQPLLPLPPTIRESAASEV